MITVPFSGLARQYQCLRKEILHTTDLVLSSGQLMNGPYTGKFESWLAQYNHQSHAITVHSGTHALEAIAEYYATTYCQNSPTVVIPALTYRATANAFVRAGWNVHFADTDSHGLIDMDSISITDYQAVVIVGLYGAGVTAYGRSDHRRLPDLQNWRFRLLIEDAAQHWLAGNGTRIGSASAISFDPTKNLSCYGNGGAVVTNSTELADFVRKWRVNSSSTINSSAGTNSRMSEVDCAGMMVKVAHLSVWQKRRQQISEYYIDQFDNTQLRCLIDKNTTNHAYHKFVIDVDQRDLVRQKLQDAGIETRIHYETPLHEEAAFSHCTGPGLLSCASALSRRVLSLPIYPELTDSEVEYVADQVRNCVTH